MAEKKGTPLAGIPAFPEPALSKLAALWITTAEELDNAARQPRGVEGLAAHLGISEDETRALVRQAVDALPGGFSFAPDETFSVGIGALDEPEGRSPEDEPVSFAPLPDQVDLRDRMPPVRNQRNRGTCVAHACVAVREFLLGPTGTQDDLSEQHLYWNCKQRDGSPDQEGTWIHVAMAAFEADGVCTEPVWRYNPDPVPGNEGQGPPPAGAAADAKKYRVARSTRLEPRWIATLRETLAGGKPIAFAVPVFNYWMTGPAWSTGDIRMPLPTDESPGGHAMCLVGYQVDASVPGGGYFVVRNSWGTDFGHDSAIAPGHARLPFAYMETYGRSAYSASIAQPPDPVQESTTRSFIDWLRRLFGG